MLLLTVLDGKDTAHCCREISKSRQVNVGNIVHLKECGTDRADDYKHHTPIGVFNGIRSRLLIRLTFVFEPTCDVSSLRIVMRPVNDAALRTPNVLAVKRNTIAFL